MKSFIDEFKKFAMRGNVIDMAVGIIIGAAFGKIVDSLVKDIMMPPIGLLLGKVDFSDLKLYLTHGENPVTVNYGLFINALISFLIVAFAVLISFRKEWLKKKQQQLRQRRRQKSVRIAVRKSLPKPAVVHTAHLN